MATDREIIDGVFDVLEANDLETTKETTEGKPISNPIPLTPELVMNVLAALRAGKKLPEIKRTVFQTGREGQKLKLTRAQIQEIAERRRYYYLRATGALVE